VQRILCGHSRERRKEDKGIYTEAIERGPVRRAINAGKRNPVR